MRVVALPSPRPDYANSTRLQQGFAFSGMGFEDQFAGQQSLAADVCFGSKADIRACSGDVRFTPKSGHRGEMGLPGDQVPDLLAVAER
jgi:hypothetical protein